MIHKLPQSWQSLPLHFFGQINQLRLNLRIASSGVLVVSILTLTLLLAGVASPVLAQTVGITQQPAATSVVCTGADVTVSISASGAVSGYKWYKGVNEISGQTSATLTLTNVQPGDTDGYTAQVLGTGGPIFANVFNLTVTQNVGITVQPDAGSVVCSGANITQTVSVSGTGPYGFQWIKGITNIQSQTTATLSLINVQQTPDADGYTLRVIGTCNNLLSNTFNLAINQAVAITAQPAPSSMVCEGANATAMVSVSGSGPFTYEWIKGVTPISSQTTATLNLSNLKPTDTDSYFVRAINPCNNVLSSPFNLTVGAVPTVTIILPNGSSVAVEGTYPTITLPPGGSANLRVIGGNYYQWTQLMDRIQGYEIRLQDANTTGQFQINRTGPYRLVVSSDSCGRIVEGQVVLQP